MESTFRPLTRKERAELHGYVKWSTYAFRASLFVAAIALLALLLRGAFRLAAGWSPLFGHAAWWIVPAILFAVGLYRRAGRWTGGRAMRRAVRIDLQRGEMAIHRIAAIDAIEIEEQEDEGPGYFILTADGTTMLFAGQYLERLKGKGFPWTSFEIAEAPSSKVFFGITRRGDRLPPSATRPPLDLAEARALGVFKADYRILDVDFATLKRGATRNDLSA